MSDDLQILDGWLTPLVAAIDPARRRRLARSLARELRRSQQQRIAAQLNPDGSPYEPRKISLRDRKGMVRRGAMFPKIRGSAHLRIAASADHAAIGFTDRVARIASVHQLGLRDRVRPGGPEVQYAARRLLGLTDTERETILECFLQAISSDR